jgi:hypothetical protein
MNESETGAETSLKVGSGSKFGSEQIIPDPQPCLPELDLNENNGSDA